MMTARTPKQSRPTLKGDVVNRANVAQVVLEDPLYVVTAPGCEYAVAWATIGREHELTILGYRPVRPEEVQEMPGGSYIPHDKDFGAWFFFDKDADTVRQGQNILMKVPVAMREARVAKELDRALNRVPQRADKTIEQATLNLGEETTLKAEMKPEA